MSSPPPITSSNIDNLSPTELLRRLQKGQKLKNELISELDLSRRRTQRMKNERNALLDAVWEQEIKNDLSLPASSSTDEGEEDVFHGVDVDDAEISPPKSATNATKSGVPGISWNTLEKSSEYSALQQMVKAMEDESADSIGGTGTVGGVAPMFKKSKKTTSTTNTTNSATTTTTTPSTTTTTPASPSDAAPFHVVIPKELKLVNYGVLQSDPAKIPNYQTRKFVFPLGFHSSCIIDKVLYNSKISDGGMYPLFTVFADAGRPFVGATPTAAWSKALNRKVNGYELYGLLSPAIKEMSLRMPTISLFEEFIKGCNEKK